MFFHPCFIASRPRSGTASAKCSRPSASTERADWKAGSLSHGQKQWLEIGMLIAQDPKLLLVDEPAAGMTDEETHKTGELLLSLAGKHSIIVIEHDMTFVRQIARKVTVLHQGTCCAKAPWMRCRTTNASSRSISDGRRKRKREH